MKIKIRLILFVFALSSISFFAQSSSLISTCNDFVSGPNSTWPFVLVATTPADSAASQGSQTYTMNVTSLPAGGANVRVYKTVSNGNVYLGNPVALTLGVNTITVAAVTFDRAVKFQFSSGDVEFDALTLNGVASSCVGTTPPPTTSLISDCGDFVSGPSAWPYVLVATTIADGAASQGSQTFEMNVTSLPAGGANVRVYKTTANGNDFFGNPVALTLCSNSITVPAVSFDRAVKFQFSSGGVEFDALTLNGDSSSCVSTPTSFTIDSVVACDSYTWIDGNTYNTSNNTATFTSANSIGCDSVITLDLTIFSSSTATDVVVACDSYTWIDGNTYTSSNNTATYTLMNTTGCDSVITLDLTITSLTSTDVIIACDSHTWIDGNIYNSSNNTATHLLTSSSGCDSIITLDLTINSSISSTDVVLACDSYSWIDGNTYTSSNSMATYLMTTSNGCDSLISLDLTISSSSSTIDVIDTCDSYTWIDGNTYTSSNNTAIYTLMNAAGCDSIVELDLNITEINPTIEIVDDSILFVFLDSNNSATYQWLDCNNNFSPLFGDTNTTFVTQTPGDYAVEVTLNNCSVISDCFTIISTSFIDDLSAHFGIKLFPNPTSDDIIISLDRINSVDIVLTDIFGKVLLQQPNLSDKDYINICNFAPGIYIVKIITTKGNGEQRIIKQ